MDDSRAPRQHDGAPPDTPSWLSENLKSEKKGGKSLLITTIVSIAIFSIVFQLIPWKRDEIETLKERTLELDLENEELKQKLALKDELLSSTSIVIQNEELSLTQIIDKQSEVLTELKLLNREKRIEEGKLTELLKEKNQASTEVFNLKNTVEKLSLKIKILESNEMKLQQLEVEIKALIEKKKLINSEIKELSQRRKKLESETDAYKSLLIQKRKKSLSSLNHEDFVQLGIFLSIYKNPQKQKDYCGLGIDFKDCIPFQYYRNSVIDKILDDKESGRLEEEAFKKAKKHLENISMKN